jgi:hypothetical protein
VGYALALGLNVYTYYRFFSGYMAQGERADESVDGTQMKFGGKTNQE